MRFLLNAVNKPIGILPDGQQLTAKEQHLKVINYDATRDEAQYILQYCYWDGSDFVAPINNSRLSDVRDRVVNIRRNNFSRQPKDKDQELQDSHLNICSTDNLDEIRRHYIDSIMTLLEHDGIEVLLSALRFGCYSDIYHAIKTLPPSTKRAMADCEALSEADKDLLARVWKVITR